MANAVMDKLGVSDAGAKVQQEIERRVSDTKGQLDRLRTDIERKRSVAVGSLKDEASGRAFGASETALSTASKLIERVHAISPLKIDAVRARTKRLASCAKYYGRKREEISTPPIAEYDELNVKKVNAALEGLSFYELQKVRAYEAANKNRVTVLREVDRLMA